MHIGRYNGKRTRVNTMANAKKLFGELQMGKSILND